MKEKETEREVRVKVKVKLETEDPIKLLDGSNVYPIELRAQYWYVLGGSPSNYWSLLVEKCKKDGSRGKATTEIGSYNFRDGHGKNAHDITPDWLLSLVAKYAPRDMTSI